MLDAAGSHTALHPALQEWASAEIQLFDKMNKVEERVQAVYLAHVILAGDATGGRGRQQLEALCLWSRFLHVLSWVQKPSSSWQL